jgi:hypothetical protein
MGWAWFGFFLYWYCRCVSHPISHRQPQQDARTLHVTSHQTKTTPKQLQSRPTLIPYPYFTSTKNKKQLSFNAPSLPPPLPSRRKDARGLHTALNAWTKRWIYSRG